MSTASEEQMERVKIAVRNEWGSRLCNFDEWAKRPCESGATCACLDVARAAIAAIAAMGEPQAERFEEALWRIAQWSKAYPLTVFPEPDLVKAAELLKAGGITLDAISAHAMRHVVEGVGEIAAYALEGRAAMGEQWREIESAPKNQIIDLLFRGNIRIVDCIWYCNEWWATEQGDPSVAVGTKATHWMPLPAPPVTA